MTENKSRLTKRNPDGSVGINDFRYYNYADFQKLANKLAEFEDIGTIEEFKALKEKNEPKKPRFYAHNYYCIECGNLVGNNEFEWQRFLYCDKCGQKLDWQ